MDLAGDALHNAEQLFAWNCVLIAIGSLAIYEHLLTSIKEIRTLWLRPLNGASVILFFNRYILLVYIFDNMASVVSDIGIKRCYLTTVLGVVCFIVLSVIFAFFAALRVYALWNRNCWVFGATLSIGLVGVVTNLYALANLNKNTQFETGDCLITSRAPRHVKTSLGRLTRIAAIVLDCLVLCLTWMKLSSHWRCKNSGGHNLGKLIFRSGCLYFIILLMLNTAEIVIFQLTEQTYGTYIITPITSILVSRFIMDLRDLHQCDRFTAITQSWKSNQISALSSFVSDLGQDLSHGFPVPEDEDDDTYGLIEDD